LFEDAIAKATAEYVRNKSQDMMDRRIRNITKSIRHEITVRYLVPFLRNNKYQKRKHAVTRSSYRRAMR
jgi:hypothetical protein